MRPCKPINTFKPHIFRAWLIVFLIGDLPLWRFRQAHSWYMAETMRLCTPLWLFLLSLTLRISTYCGVASKCSGKNRPTNDHTQDMG